MKKLSGLFLSALALTTIVSCNKDDDEKAASIEGKWQISKEGESLTTLEAAENEGNCGLDIIEFVSGGVFKETDYYNNGTGCTTDNDEGQWSKKDNTLTIKFGDDENKVEVLELTETTLKLKIVDEEGPWIEVFTKK